MRTIALDEAATALSEWFTRLRRDLDATVFAAGATEAHQNAAARHVVTRHAAGLDDAVKGGQTVDEVREVAWVLAGATRALGIELRREQWLAAAKNVARLEAQVEGVSSPWVESAVSIFRSHFFEALRQAGMTREATILDAANRRTALGLAVNWGMRYLIAAAAGLDGDAVADPAVHEIVAAVSGG